VILTWNEFPRDLDVHVEIPRGDYTFKDGQKTCDVWYKNPKCETSQKLLMGVLDFDATRGFGPETATLRGEYVCVYASLYLLSLDYVFLTFDVSSLHTKAGDCETVTTRGVSVCLCRFAVWHTCFLPTILFCSTLLTLGM
jgi:uncharacterized protein YfaP (DUF2135 family)